MPRALKKDLPELLLEDGVVSPEDLAEIEKSRLKSGLGLIETLKKKGLVEEEKLLATLARKYGYRFEGKLNFEHDPVFEKIPGKFIDKFRIIPVQKKGQKIICAVSDPTEIHPMDDLRKILRKYQVEFIVTPETEIIRIIHSVFDRSSDTAREVMDNLGDEDYSDLDSLSEDTLDLANEAPIIRMVNAILTQAVQQRASDIHIEPYEKSLEVRFRVDGIMQKRLTPPKVIHSGLVSRIKIMANLNIAENRLPQDGRIKIKLAGKEIDIRVSIIPTRYGERVVMRLLNKTDISFNLDNLGFYKDIYENIHKIIREPNGIILVTGPTGAGKSTTLYGILSELNQEHRNILTAEDPVEYEISGVSQMQVHEKIGLTFASALRAMLRQDPDVIMVGEMRDEETARIAIQAALTGHLVLSTLHTNDAPSAITRLIDMGIEPYLITSTVRAIMAQRLVRVICDHCKTTYKPASQELNDFGLKPARLKKGLLFRGKGCEECQDTGYKGRTGIYEFMEMTPKVQKGILKGLDAEGIKEIALSDGMISLYDYGQRKVIDGVTTPAEVIRVG